MKRTETSQLPCPVAIAVTRATCRSNRIAYTVLRANRQMPMRIPLILDIIRRPLKMPIR